MIYDVALLIEEDANELAETWTARRKMENSVCGKQSQRRSERTCCV